MPVDKSKKQIVVQEDEIDLVDLLGVLIKKRKFIVWFIVLFTLIFSSLSWLREYSMTRSYLDSHQLEYALSSENDAIFSSFMFISKSNDVDKYKSFIDGLFYPAGLGRVSFEIVANKDTGFTTYFFSSEDAFNKFRARYESFLSNLTSLKSSVKGMSDETMAICQQLLTSRIPLGRDVVSLFPSYKEMNQCNLFTYYFTLIQGLIRDASNTTISYTYVPFITGVLEGNNELKVLEEGTSFTRSYEHKFDSRKVLKYSVLIFILSLVIAFVMSFILEFYDKNKARLKTYW